MNREQMRVTYSLQASGSGEAEQRAHDIALEQTVELPERSLPSHIRTSVVAQTTSLEQVDDRHWRAVIDFPATILDGRVSQLLNVLYGNISLKHGIVVTDVWLPNTFLARCPGPRFGIDGLRGLCASGRDRPLLCTALKPVGLTASELAERCHAFALGGIDIIKDDHGLGDQEVAPFDERVAKCQAAVDGANLRTGRHSRYFPHVLAAGADLERQLEVARKAGCRGVLMAPLLVGVDAVRAVADAGDLAILTHPSLTGVFFGPDHGIAPHVLLGVFFRLLGGDGVIFPHAGGRFSHPHVTGPFSFTPEVCRALTRELRRPLSGVSMSVPVPAGGIDARRVPALIAEYGVDTIFLVGGSLYERGDLSRAGGDLLSAIRQPSQAPDARRQRHPKS